MAEGACVPCAVGDWKEAHDNAVCRPCKAIDPFMTTIAEGTARQGGCVCEVASARVRAPADWEQSIGRLEDWEKLERLAWSVGD